MSTETQWSGGYSFDGFFETNCSRGAGTASPPAYCKQLGVKNVAIRGDALNVLNALDMSAVDLSDIGVFDGVRKLLEEFDIVSWKHKQPVSSWGGKKILLENRPGTDLGTPIWVGVFYIMV